ncbi:hypothetical protein Leryth_014826 [Lithospermum erythrorhizon]|nr:hypothetical protein Leryth_014826 [Lithospermum erythrorhizon]
MEEASKVRLVRCPKCGNILPQLPNLSVFKCGACFAVLQAKDKEIVDDRLSEVSEEGEKRDVDEKGEINVNSKDVIINEGGDDGMYGSREEGKSQREKSISNSQSAVRTEERKRMAHSVRTRQGGEILGPRFNQGRKIAFHDNDDCRWDLRNSIDDPASPNQGDVDLCRVEQQFANSSLEDEMDGIRPPARSRRTMSVTNDLRMERNGSVSSWRNGENVIQQGRFAKPPYSDEGPSNYETSSYRGYGEQLRYPEGEDGLASVAHLENDRAELLKKLDELKEQISKSGEVVERHLERIPAGRRPPIPPEPYARHGAYTPEGIPFHFEKQAIHSDKYFPAPPNLTVGHRRATSIQRPDLYSNDSYLSNQFPNAFAGYRDAYHPQLSRRPFYQPSRPYSQQGYVDRFPDGRIKFNRDPFMSHPQEATFHQPACSCSHCLNNNWYGPADNPNNMPSILSSRHDPTNVAPYHHMNGTEMGPTSYSSDGSHPYDQLQFTRPPRLMDSKNNGFHNQQPRQVTVSKGGTQVNRPMAGGAPFIACLHCFELLKIPVKILQGTNQGKVKCGACSSIFQLECGIKGIVLSVSGENTHALENASYFSDEVPNDKLLTDHDWLKDNSKIPSSGGHDHSDFVPKESPEEHSSTSRESEKRRLHHISCSSFSEDEESPDSVIVRETVSHPTNLSTLKHDALPSLKDSPHKARPDTLQSNDSTNLYGKVNKDESMGNEKTIVEKINSRQGSVKEAPVASEMDISVNDYTNSAISQASTEVSKEGSKSKINKFAGLVKRSLKDLTGSGHEIEHEKSNILINGHLITERLLKKAEKVAGPIQPGEYWYDYRAGFWGVMGHPCFGIIPPKIEEFKFPIPDNCSNGNTKVFVNGRELHQEDLDLLSRRGLPTTRHKYYVIEISGKVVDEQTGEKLESLGKLAPTVERVGHGFGMKIPKFIAQGV